MKKIQSPRLEACYCNIDDTRARPSPEPTSIQANCSIKAVQVTTKPANIDPQDVPRTSPSNVPRTSPKGPI